MSRRIVAFVVFAFAAAALFVRLGFWQLHRRMERRELNSAIASRRVAPPAEAFALAGDTLGSPHRRAYATGSLDYANEIVLASRSRDGAPGVWILTPLRPAGRDTALLVVRGWAYSPDAVTVDLARWHEADSTFSGYLMSFAEPPQRASAPARMNGRILRRLELPAARELIPYPIAPLYLVATEDSSKQRAQGTASAANRLARLEPLPLDEGPHLSYAIQWFSFGTIAVIGALIVAKRARENGQPGRGD